MQSSHIDIPDFDAELKFGNKVSVLQATSTWNYQYNT
jgi:hypothetical protein